MENRLKQGGTAFIVENNWRVRQVRITSISGGFATISFVDGMGITRLRFGRLFATRKEAESRLNKR